MSRSAGLDGTAQRVVAAAAQEIRQIGPKRMTILGIAGKLGMSHANIYRHFADKRAVIDAVLAQALRPIETRLAEIADGPDPADDKLERFLTTLTRAYDELIRQDVAIFRLLTPPDAAPDEPTRHRRRVASLIGRIVEEGVATRLFTGGDPRRITQLLLDLVHRFVDPPAILLAQDLDAATDGRRDRVLRAAIRTLTGNR